MRKAKLHFYRDAQGQWRWRLRASNGRILADSGEGYRRLASARHGAHLVRTFLSDAELAVEVTR